MRKKLAIGVAAACCCAAVLGACGSNMSRDARLKPYEPDPALGSLQTERHLPADTVSREQSTNTTLLSGMAGGQPVGTIPLKVTREVLATGEQRYATFCVPCHGAAAMGDGPVSGYFNPRPYSLVGERVRNLADGQIYAAISNGYRTMYSYGDRITPEDRWAIVAYIRALQQNPNDPLGVAPETIAQSGGQP